MKKRKLLLCVLVFALIICASIQPAIAYFTTFTYALGGHPIYIHDTTKITETFFSREKHITIKSDSNSEPVWVRAKVFWASQDIASVVIEGSSWSVGKTDENGYTYYNYTKVLPTGGETDELTVTINFKENITPEKGDQFNVIVIYESTPVRYDPSGNELPADWDSTLIDSKTLEV